MKKILTVVGVLTVLVFCVSCTRESEFEGSIYGVIIDLTGEPISNASVLLTPTGKTQTTGSTGHYEFIDLDPGQYTVTASASSYKTDRKTMAVKAGERVNADFRLNGE
jgi:uncharacterized membrane protein